MKSSGEMNSETSINHPILPSTANPGGGGTKTEVRGELES